MAPQQTTNPNGCRDAAALTSEERKTMTTETLTMPEPLDPSRLHSPAEVRIHAAKVAAYRDAVREEEAAQRRKQEAVEAAADTPVNEHDYYRLALKRQQEQQERDAKRAAERKQQEQAEAAYLDSFPETAEVTAQSEFLFLTKLALWIGKGYRVTEESIRYWVPGFYCVNLAAPVSTKGGKQ